MHRIVWLLAICLGTSVAALAQDKPADWIADPRSGCRVWNNYPQDDDRITWDGPCVDGYAHGRGMLRWYSQGENYETAEGEFRRGKLNGHGVAKGGGETFEGEFRDNRPNGQGTLRAADGEVYTGTWKDGCFEEGGRRAVFFTTPEECGFPKEPGRSI